MDFEKLLAQREAKQAAIEQPAPAEPPKPSTARRSATSKRSTWIACTFYLPAETKARLKRVLLQQELAGTGSAADQSEAINEALLAWLEKAERAAT
jgi:hypothetical protein